MSAPATPGQLLYEDWLRARGVSVHDMWDRIEQEKRTAWDAIAGELAAFDALLSLVVENTKPFALLGSEHRIWVSYRKWKAGAQSTEEAREALKDVIRAALIEQAGGTDAR